MQEHINWIIHTHGQLCKASGVTQMHCEQFLKNSTIRLLSKVINKLITIPIEGSSVSIPGVSICAYYGNIGGLIQDEDVGWALLH